MRMNHTKQRVRSLLSLFLVFLMIFGALPINALADAGIEGGNWKTNFESVHAVNDAVLTQKENGLQIQRSDSGNTNAWAMSSAQREKNFTLETDVTFVSGNVVNLILELAHRRRTTHPSYINLIVQIQAKPRFFILEMIALLNPATPVRPIMS